jgi:AcrR family transcriptional regulator
MSIYSTNGGGEMNRAEQKEQRRIEIMSKALELFAQKGYAGTRTSEIAKALGMSEGLMFHYFPTKESLYLELVKNGAQGTEVFPEKIDDPYKAFYDVLQEFFTRVQENGRLVAKMFVLMNAAQNKDGTPEEVYKIASAVNIVQASVPVIEQGQEKGVFRVGDPLTLSYTFWNAFDGNMVELAKNPEMNPPDPVWLMAILTK